MNNRGTGLRVKPLQQRAKDTMDLILNTSLIILDEVGPDAFTTKLVAERAGIRIRNVYRYFENKQAIFFALAKIMADKQSELINNFEFVKNSTIELPAAVDKTVDSFFDGVIRLPGMLPLRIAMLSSPELQSVEDQLNKTIAAELATALKERGTSIPKRRLDLVCSIILYIATSLLDRAGLEILASGDISAARRIISELKKVLHGYLAQYY